MRYLSEQWIAAADAAVNEASTSAPAGRVVIDQHIAESASYRVVVERDAASIEAITESRDDASAKTTPNDVDAVFRQNYNTARAVAIGETDAHQAFLLGQIQFTGNIEVLIERREAFDWLATTLAPLMAVTEF